MAERHFSYKIASISASIAIISITSVLAIPLFPNQRNVNYIGLVLRIIINEVTSVFLMYELWRGGIFQHLWRNFRRLFYMLFGKNGHEYEVIVGESGSVAEHHYLTYLFFFGYAFCELTKIANLFYLSTSERECFAISALLGLFIDFQLGLLILIAIIYKRLLPNVRWYSYFVWSVVGASCFCSAFKYVVEEVVWSYIEIVELSIQNKTYGLDIPDNITNAVDYIEKIFKLRTKCLEHGLLSTSKVMKWVYELIPFSTEYFSIATFFAFLNWINLNSSENHSKQNQENVFPPPPVQGNQQRKRDQPQTQGNQHQREQFQIQGTQQRKIVFMSIEDDGQMCEGPASQLGGQENRNAIANVEDAVAVSSFSLRKAMLVYSTGILITLGTITSITMFYLELKDETAVIIFIIQQTILQLVLLVIELYVYFRHLKYLNYSLQLPNHFQLDVLLLIFPLFPLGILLSLRVFPDLVDLNTASHNPFNASKVIWMIFNIGLAAFQWFEVAFQAFFISQLFCTLNDPWLKANKSIFSLLSAINGCVWLSWTLECKLITIHGRSFLIFGVVQWTIIVYSTVPFILFCFAHSAACFLEIRTHISKESHDVQQKNNLVNSFKKNSHLWLTHSL